jgi:CBS domain-containing protein
MKREEPKIKSVMTPFPHSVDVRDRIGVARKLMLENHVHHLPVTHGHKLDGIITDRDIKLLLGPELGSPDPRELTVEDAYIQDGYTVDLDTPLADVAQTMAQRHIGAAVVTKGGRLAGIFTASDACRELARQLKDRYRVPPEVA